MALWCSRLARQPVTLEVDGSSPFGVAICGCSSSGRAPPCQGGGSEFEPRHPLHKNDLLLQVVFFMPWDGFLQNCIPQGGFRSGLSCFIIAVSIIEERYSMKMSYIKRLTISALCIALCVVLPIGEQLDAGCFGMFF